jgi:hypothetical protein
MDNHAANDRTEHTPKLHQVVADGKVIYAGNDWQRIFLEARMNPEYGEIVHVPPDGTPGAQWGAPLAYRREGEEKP